MIHFTSPAGELPVHRDQLRAQRSVTSMGKLYVNFLHVLRTSPYIQRHVIIAIITTTIILFRQEHSIKQVTM